VRWDAAAYDRDFGFVAEYGADLLKLLDVEPPASVIDVGCGTGSHAAALAARGFDVVGVDLDPAMVERATLLHPGIEFVAADVQTMRLDRSFDAAISNAALHWMVDQASALTSIRSALRSGAQFVAEMGGQHNVAVVDSALERAVATMGFGHPPIRKFFPTVAEQAALLEGAGFVIRSMWWFPRPTPLAQGQTPAAWTKLFRSDVWRAIPEQRHAELARLIDADCAPLYDEGAWYVDYWRLRFVAGAV
jgi:trans-aconitate methyltransferase